MNISSTTGGKGTDYGRITGLATGMDIDAMVESMLSGENSKIQKTQQSKQSLQWQQEAYIEIINNLKEFYKYFQPETSGYIMSPSNYTGTKALSSMESAITAGTLPGAVKGTYEIKVSNLAAAPTAKGSFGDTIYNKGTKLSEITFPEGQQLNDGEDIKITAGNKVFTVSINKEKTIEQLVGDIKNATAEDGTNFSSLGNVYFSELTGKLTIEGKATGEGEFFEIQDGSSNLASLMKISGTHKGADALVFIKAPGESDFAEVIKSTNTFTIDNITYKPTKVTGDEVVTLTVTSDAKEAYDTFKGFIDKYNTLVEKINTKITEKKNYDFAPLTDAQKEDMTEDQIKKWEDSAKQGVLRRDNNLTKLLSDLRNSIYETVENAGLSINEIGLSTTKNYMDGGKLQLDPEKFKAAIENKGDLLQKLFTSTGSEKSSQGIFTRFKNIINENIGYDGVLIKKAGYENTRFVTENDLTKKITEKSTLIKELNRKLAIKRESLYIKFASLEISMNSLNSQCNWLYSQFSAS